MHYTIATMKEVQGNMEIDFNKNGNKYQVGIYNHDTKEYTHRDYENAEVAEGVFLRLANAIITGCYSYETRKSWLA